MPEYVVRTLPGAVTTRVSRPGGVTRVRTRLTGGVGGGPGATALADLTDVDVTSDPPAQDDVLAWDEVAGEWTPATLDGGSGVDLSDATPAALGTAAPGVGTEASRADHVHGMPAAADVGADPAGTAAGLVDDLSGVSNQSTARTNLGLGGAATLNVGTTAGTVAAGDDSRFGAGGGGFDDWTVIGDLGATETITGTDGSLARYFGTVDQACTVTVSLSNDQQIDFIAQQNVTGLNAVTFSGVDVWMTSTGSAPSTAGRAGLTVDRFRFERINSVTFGYWVTEPSVSSFARRTSGHWYAPDGRENQTLTTTANRLMFSPFDTPDVITLDRVTINVLTGASGSSVRFGVYSDTGGGKPGSLIEEFGAITTTGTGDMTPLTVSRTLQPGRYYLAAVAQGGTPQLRGMAGPASLSTTGSTTLADVSGANPMSYYQNGVSGSMPSTATPLVANLPIPRIMVRLA